MRLAADENVERQIVEWLRAQGHDVLYGAESTAGEGDPYFLQRASAESRIAITNDLDFGELVIWRGMHAVGVLLLRLEVASLSEKVRAFTERWPRVEPILIGNLVVMTLQKIRTRSLP